MSKASPDTQDLTSSHYHVKVIDTTQNQDDESHHLCKWMRVYIQVESALDKSKLHLVIGNRNVQGLSSATAGGTAASKRTFKTGGLTSPTRMLSGTFSAQKGSSMKHLHNSGPRTASRLCIHSVTPRAAVSPLSQPLRSRLFFNLKDAESCTYASHNTPRQSLSLAETPTHHSFQLPQPATLSAGWRASMMASPAAFTWVSASSAPAGTQPERLRPHVPQIAMEDQFLHPGMACPLSRHVSPRQGPHSQQQQRSTASSVATPVLTPEHHPRPHPLSSGFVSVVSHSPPPPPLVRSFHLPIRTIEEMYDVEIVGTVVEVSAARQLQVPRKGRGKKEEKQESTSWEEVGSKEKGGLNSGHGRGCQSVSPSGGKGSSKRKTTTTNAATLKTSKRKHVGKGTPSPITSPPSPPSLMKEQVKFTSRLKSTVMSFFGGGKESRITPYHYRSHSPVVSPKSPTSTGPSLSRSRSRRNPPPFPLVTTPVRFVVRCRGEEDFHAFLHDMVSAADPESMRTTPEEAQLDTGGSNLHVCQRDSYRSFRPTSPWDPYASSHDSTDGNPMMKQRYGESEEEAGLHAGALEPKRWHRFVRYTVDPRNELCFSRFPAPLWRPCLPMGAAVTYSCERGFLVVERGRMGDPLASTVWTVSGVANPAILQHFNSPCPGNIPPGRRWNSIKLALTPAEEDEDGERQYCGSKEDRNATSRTPIVQIPNVRGVGDTRRCSDDSVKSEHMENVEEGSAVLTCLRDVFMCLTETHLIFINSFGEVKFHCALEEIALVAYSEGKEKLSNMRSSSGSMEEGKCMVAAPAAVAAAGMPSSASFPSYPLICLRTKSEYDSDGVIDPPLVITFTFLPLIPTLRHTYNEEDDEGEGQDDENDSHDDHDNNNNHDGEDEDGHCGATPTTTFPTSGCSTAKGTTGDVAASEENSLVPQGTYLQLHALQQASAAQSTEAEYARLQERQRGFLKLMRATMDSTTFTDCSYREYAASFVEPASPMRQLASSLYLRSTMVPSRRLAQAGNNSFTFASSISFQSPSVPQPVRFAALYPRDVGLCIDQDDTTQGGTSREGLRRMLTETVCSTDYDMDLSYRLATHPTPMLIEKSDLFLRPLCASSTAEDSFMNVVRTYRSGKSAGNGGGSSNLMTGAGEESSGGFEARIPQRKATNLFRRHQPFLK